MLHTHFGQGAPVPDQEQDTNAVSVAITAITLAARLGYGRETLVIDGSNVGDSSKHSGVRKATAFSRLSLAESLSEKKSI